MEIQQGFTWNVYSSLDAPQEPMPVKPIDDLKFRDLHDVELIHHGGGLDEQIAIEDLQFEDFHYIDMEMPPQSLDVDETDSVEFIDFHGVDIQYGPRVYNLAELSDLELNDFIETIVRDASGEPKNVEETGFEDFVDMDM